MRGLGKKQPPREQSRYHIAFLCVQVIDGHLSCAPKGLTSMQEAMKITTILPDRKLNDGWTGDNCSSNSSASSGGSMASFRPFSFSALSRTTFTSTAFGRLA